MKKHLQDIQDSMQRAWSDAVASLHGVEEEVAHRFRQIKERADLQQGSEEAQRLLADLGRRLQDSTEVMEKKLEDSVRTVYSRLRNPLADEVARLRQRAEQISRRIESQLRRNNHGAEHREGPPSSSSDAEDPTR